LLAMEPPINLTPDEIRSEKVKVLRALRLIEEDEVDDFFVRGQYGGGHINDKTVPAYRDEAYELNDSNTETYVAGKDMIANYNWSGLPFYFRTGKPTATTSMKLVNEFKEIPSNF